MTGEGQFSKEELAQIVEQAVIPYDIRKHLSENSREYNPDAIKRSMDISSQLGYVTRIGNQCFLTENGTELIEEVRTKNGAQPLSMEYEQIRAIMQGDCELLGP